MIENFPLQSLGFLTGHTHVQNDTKVLTKMCLKLIFYTINCFIRTHNRCAAPLQQFLAVTVMTWTKVSFSSWQQSQLCTIVVLHASHQQRHWWVVHHHSYLGHSFYNSSLSHPSLKDRCVLEDHPYWVIAVSSTTVRCPLGAC